jgi:hypothetical protein
MSRKMMLVGAGALPFPFRSGWDHEFESAFLHRRVYCEPDLTAAAAAAGSLAPKIRATANPSEDRKSGEHGLGKWPGHGGTAAAVWNGKPNPIA